MAETNQNLSDQIGQAASNLADKAQETGRNVFERSKDMAQTAASRVSDTARAVGNKAEQATNRIGDRMKSVAHNLRDKAPESGLLHRASESVADSLESGGDYIQQKGISGMAGDVTDLIRRHPIPALLLAVGIGFLVARTLRS